MAMLERRLKQRIVGAAVLLALMVVFLPMLFNREDDQRRVRVEAPPMPAMPAPVVTPNQPVSVPEPQRIDEAVSVSPQPSPAQAAPSLPVERNVQAPPVSAAAAPSTAPAQQPTRLDVDGVPVTWSVQLASLSSRARAEELQRKLRAQGQDAYIRSVDGMNRVFVGPLLERADAERVRDQIARQLRLSPIVVRFQPERR